MMRQLLLTQVIIMGSVAFLCGQSPVPTDKIALPQAIYAPKPEYRPEWAKQGLTGKGVVLVTIDPATGKVSGAKMLESTGNKLLDGAALQAYSQWRFKPGSVPQVKMPIEFSNRPPRQSSQQKLARSPMTYLLIFVGLTVALLAIRGKFNR